MPQKTKKQKMKSQERIEDATQKNEVKQTEAASSPYFTQDIKKSLVIIGSILVFEIGLFIASNNGLIPFIPAK